MSVFTKQTVVETYPAYVIAKRDTNKGYYDKINHAYVNLEFTDIVDGDILGLDSKKGFYREYTPGSVVSYALQYNEDPYYAVERAIENGHKLHWINANGASITSHKQAQRTLIKVELGMVVRFQGLIATIEADHNDNLKFVPI